LHAGASLDEASIYVDTEAQSLAKLLKASKSMGVLLKKVVGTPSQALAKKMMGNYKAFDLSVKEYVKRNG
jgi:hypothetical protein